MNYANEKRSEKRIAKLSESTLSEFDLSPVGDDGKIKTPSKLNRMPVGERFYPRKVRKPLKNAPLTVELLNAFVQPAVALLNRGKDLKPKSLEHHQLRELLELINR